MRKVIQQKPDALSRYLRGYTEAISIIRRDKETAIKVMGKFMKTDNGSYSKLFATNMRRFFGVYR